MSDTADIGTYSFLPWVRQGIANRIDAQDQDPSVDTRATIDVTLRVTGSGGDAAVQSDIPRSIELFGPGDIVGIDRRAIIGNEPRHWITNFEPNYLPYVDFYDEDFAWRYTPATPLAANPRRLKPWLALLVLEEGDERGGHQPEFQEGITTAGKPLPYIVVSDPSVFPESADCWAWAHVHINRSLIADPTDVSIPNVNDPAVLDEFERVVADEPDEAYCRLMSPRKLRPNTAYHAFVVPAFETGRLAGLGLDPSLAPHATHAAWDAYPNGVKEEPNHYPVYHRWYFRTASRGDFEYLVRLLEPRPMDRRVGTRDMDVQTPGSNVPGISDAKLGGVLKLGGALRIPEDTFPEAERLEVEKFENWDEPYPHQFQARLAELVNLADAYSVESVKDAHDATGLIDLDPNDQNPDPLITAPLYGRWHALTQRLLRERNGTSVPNDRNWVHELNLDPRFRAAGGFGTSVVQDNQDDYMEAAWAQIGDVIEANRQIRLAMLATQVSNVWYTKHLTAIAEHDAGHFLAMTAPLDRRLVLDGVVRRHGQSGTLVPHAVVSAPMRRLTRPRGRVMRTLDVPPELAEVGLVARLDTKQVRPAPPKVTPPELPTTDELADRVEPQGPLGRFAAFLRSVPPLVWAALLVLLVAAAVFGVVRGPLVLFIVAVVVLVVLAPFAAAALRRARTTPARSPPPPGLQEISRSPLDRLRALMRRVAIVLGRLVHWIGGLRLVSAITTWRWVGGLWSVLRRVGAAVWSLLRRIGALIASAWRALVRLLGRLFAAVGRFVDRIRQDMDRADAADGLRAGNVGRDIVRDLPFNSGFELTAPGAPAIGIVGGGTDSVTAARFKDGLRDSLRLIHAADRAAPDVTPVRWRPDAIAENTLELIDAKATIPARTLGRVRIPGRIADNLVETFVEPMAYPEFDMPMYEPLVAISDELFLPNLQFVPNNCISLLETNQRFIEAYMVGLNHEMARELLWNEYLTDQRGTYFRQFWDVSSVLSPASADPEATKEALRDIPPIHLWPKKSELGDHDHREKPGENEEEIVVVIRGELLKRYPDAVILAHRADWHRDANSGAIDKNVPRDLVDLTAAERPDPPRSKVRTPLYEAKVDPDIHFFGFDLTAVDARGETEDDPDDPGWFIVIQERPGEPRFGLDVDQDGQAGGDKNDWSDFSWTDVMPGHADGDFLDATAAPTANFTTPPASASDEEKAQHAEDKQIVWDSGIGAVELAYILYQVPVLVAVHASQMLPEGEEP